MTVKQMLDMIWEEQKVNLCFCDGIRGRACDLAASLNDEALSDEVELIEADGDEINIHLC